MCSIYLKCLNWLLFLLLNFEFGKGNVGIAYVSARYENSLSINCLPAKLVTDVILLNGIYFCLTCSTGVFIIILFSYNAHTHHSNMYIRNMIANLPNNNTGKCRKRALKMFIIYNI